MFQVKGETLWFAKLRFFLACSERGVLKPELKLVAH